MPAINIAQCNASNIRLSCSPKILSYNRKTSHSDEIHVPQPCENYGDLGNGINMTALHEMGNNKGNGFVNRAYNEDVPEENMVSNGGITEDVPEENMVSNGGIRVFEMTDVTQPRNVPVNGEIQSEEKYGNRYRNKDVEEGNQNSNFYERAGIDKTLQEEEAQRKTEEMQYDGKGTLLYGVNDNPPWYTCLLLGFQHYLMMVESTVSIPYLLTPLLCLPDTHPTRALIASTIIFVSGMVTMWQTTVGIRLPIVQGGTHGFLGPILSILALMPCPPSAETETLTEEQLTELWTVRMRSIQGAICAAAVFQVVVGLTGAVGVLLRWITPLVIVPTISLIGFSLFPVAANKSSSNWGIAVLTIVLLVLFSQYLGGVAVPVPTYSKGRWRRSSVYAFKLFPVVLAVGISWGTCYGLTVWEVLPAGDAARTDVRLTVLQEAPWFRVPYPGQWGRPTVTVGGAVGVLAGVLASIVESIGDYYACARIAGAPPPPPHAINRGIYVEGVGTFMAGMFGTGTGTTSYSQNIGAIAVTRVGSRRVMQAAAFIMIVCGLMGKVGAFFIIIPEPIIGGIFVVVFSLITSVGLSTLQYVPINFPRNLFVLGFSLFTGMALPMWMRQGANLSLLQTGYPELDQVLMVLLSTSMFVGGGLAFLLDNTIPGSDRERGLDKWRAEMQVHVQGAEGGEESCYNPPLVTKFCRRWAWCRYVPTMPTFIGWEAILKKRQ